MKKHFLLVDYEQLRCTKLFSLKQGIELVEEYKERFHELSIQNQVWESEAQLVARYKARFKWRFNLR